MATQLRKEQLQGLKCSGSDINTGTDDTKFATPKAIADSIIFNSPRGYLLNGKIVPSVSSNNLTVALKTMAGNDPSASDPVYCRIGDTVRSITSALSVTKNAGTNWCNAGSSELATKEIDYFVYLGYNATDGVVIGFSRIPYGAEYDDFSTTTTNEKYCAISTITNAAAGDDYENIGRFAATLSAGAGYTWTVPTFTNKNLIQRPIFVSRLLVWNPTYSASGSMTWSASSIRTPKYQVRSNTVKCWDYPSGTTGGSADIGLYSTLPLTPIVDSFRTANGCCADEGGGDSMCGYIIWNGSQLACRKYNNSNWGIGANKGFVYEFEFEI